ncbi:hypothetical protein M0812_21464 [Anaeramoeba flamelloides]|uniref:Transmembrane protein n=1 Tax=Anaeramoeba flamelloides TaxID=1746091 RepID=A0AAV7YS07_9EUKA|nr:hypothetical protein M0812_21464 [Anaeramoeba flamelloides]
MGKKAIITISIIGAIPFFLSLYWISMELLYNRNLTETECEILSKSYDLTTVKYNDDTCDGEETINYVTSIEVKYTAGSKTYEKEACNFNQECYISLNNGDDCSVENCSMERSVKTCKNYVHKTDNFYENFDIGKKYTCWYSNPNNEYADLLDSKNALFSIYSIVLLTVGILLFLPGVFVLVGKCTGKGQIERKKDSDDDSDFESNQNTDLEEDEWKEVEH